METKTVFWHFQIVNFIYFIYSAKKKNLPPSSEVKCYFFYFSLEGVKQDPIMPIFGPSKKRDNALQISRRDNSAVAVNLQEELSGFLMNGD